MLKPKFLLLLLFCMIGVTVRAQKDTSARFNIGDPAPPLRVKEWIKGTPVKSFEKGKVYVVEFWATWCSPCILAMPHLSRLARKYKRKVTFSAIDIWESHVTKTISMAQLKTFVDSMGRRMNFSVAAEDTGFTVHDWFKAFDEEGIPTTFVIDAQGRVAWIGHPNHLDSVLQKIVNNTWDIKAALFKRVFDDQWEKSDYEVVDKVHQFQGRYYDLGNIGFPDSTLSVINEMVKKRPDLKYTPWMVSYTFSALLLSDPQKAYEYGKAAMATTTYDGPAYSMIIGDIKSESRKVNMTPDIYRLGAECYQAEIDRLIYPEHVDRAIKYRTMAQWYRLAGDESKAIKAEKKALKFEKADFRKDVRRYNNLSSNQ